MIEVYFFSAMVWFYTIFFCWTVKYPGLIMHLWHKRLLNHIGGITGKNVFPKTTSSSVLFWPQPKNIQFTVIEEEINQKIFRIIKLQSEWKKSSNLLIHFKKYLANNWLIITALGPMLYFKMDKIKHICIYEKEILIVPCSASRTTSICPL